MPKAQYGKPWQRLRKLVLARDGWRCRSCGRPGALEVDHRVPLRRGGTDHPDNLQALCRSCHIEKSRRETPRRVPTPTEAAWKSAVAELRG